MTTQQIQIIIAITLPVIGLFTAIIAWFLKKIDKSFEETKNDVKQLLITGASRDQIIKNVQDDVHELVKTTESHDNRLRQVEIEVHKLVTAK